MTIQTCNPEISGYTSDFANKLFKTISDDTLDFVDQALTFSGDEGGLDSLGFSSIDVTQPRVALQVILIINTFYENHSL